MKKLFEISKMPFYESDFQDDLREFEDLFPLIEGFQEDLKLEKIQCTDDNDCCYKTRDNYITELIGVLTEDDDFYSLEEVKNNEEQFSNRKLQPFGIQIYKCLGCGKWMINILE